MFEYTQGIEDTMRYIIRLCFMFYSQVGVYSYILIIGGYKKLTEHSPGFDFGVLRLSRALGGGGVRDWGFQDLGPRRLDLSRLRAWGFRT